MELGPDAALPASELVRCMACQRVYSQASSVTSLGAPACPACGDPSWITAAIPLATALGGEADRP